MPIFVMTSEFLRGVVGADESRLLGVARLEGNLVVWSLDIWPEAGAMSRESPHLAR